MMETRLKSIAIMVLIWALATALTYMAVRVDLETPQKQGYVEMCKYIKYDSSGVAIDSGYFPVTLFEVQK